MSETYLYSTGTCHKILDKQCSSEPIATSEMAQKHSARDVKHAEVKGLS